MTGNSRRTLISIVVAALCITLMAACSGDDSPAAPTTVAPTPSGAEVLAERPQAVSAPPQHPAAIVQAVSGAERIRLPQPPELPRRPATTPQVSDPSDQELPEFPWQQDGIVEDTERSALRSLADIQQSDPATAQVLTELPWMGDEVLLQNAAFLADIRELASKEPILARTVATQSWIADEVTVEEAQAVSSIREIAEQSGAAARNVATYPWLRDGVDRNELDVLAVVQDIAAGDTLLAQAVAESAWVADGVSDEEHGTLVVIRQVAEEQAPLAQSVVEEAAQDGLTGDQLAQLTGRGDNAEQATTGGAEESPHPEALRKILVEVSATLWPGGWTANPNKETAFNAIVVAGQADTALAERMAGFPWLADGITRDEVQALEAVRILAQMDLPGARRLAGYPWVADGINPDEGSGLFYLAALADRSPALVQHLTGLDWLSRGIDQHTGDALRELNFLHQVHIVQELFSDIGAEGLTNLLLGQPWFQDDISPEEAAVMVAMKSACRVNHVCLDLIANGWTASETLALPSGNVNLYVVSRTPVGRAELRSIFDKMGMSASSIEDFLGIPWKPVDVVLYLEPEISYLKEAPAFFAGNHVVFGTHPDNTVKVDLEILAHEFGHYYFNYQIPHWLGEGAAEFLASYTLHRSGSTTMDSSFALAQERALLHCPSGVSNIYEMYQVSQSDPQAFRGGSRWLCPYVLGETLLMALYHNLGPQMLAGALRDIHQLAASECNWQEHTGPCNGVTESMVYNLFSANTPAEQQDLLQDLYRRYYGALPGTRTGEAQADYELLVRINEALGAGLWDDYIVSDVDMSEWPGIRADFDGRVIILDLRGRNLSGPIPPEIGGLSALQALDLAINNFSGQVPAELANLTNLERLFLGGNMLTGCIPGVLLPVTYDDGGLPFCEPPAEREALTAFYNAAGGPNWKGSENWLVNTAPLGTWEGVETDSAGNVVRLQLYDYDLEGTIPPELGQLEHLRHLELSQNRLSGPIPPELGQLASLERLTLSGNLLSGPIPPELGNLSQLRSLEVSDNRLQGQIPQELGQLSRLQSLTLSRNLLEGCIPQSLADILREAEAQTLGLPFCGGSSQEHQASTPAEGSPEGDRASLVALYNATGGSNWTNNENWLSEAPLNNWAGVQTGATGRVTLLYLKDNGLSGTLSPELGSLSSLRTLGLPENRLTGPIPPELGNLSQLRNLDLGGNGLTGPIPPMLGDLENLEYLGLHSNQLNGPIPAELGRLANLQHLKLGGNELKGPIPPELGKLENVQYLELEKNQLTGAIPPELGSLTEAVTIRLFENRLTGAIPEELMELAESAGVSMTLIDNELTGCVPGHLNIKADLPAC
ncbi:MAG: hypothetical protein OXI91_05925 [Chloroflexota bacterium]|nr:hypothetical protein [Chloroflexota bacterium]